MAVWRQFILIAAAWLALPLLCVRPVLAAPAVSNCLAVAEQAPNVIPAEMKFTALNKTEVRVSFVGHSTFLIETAAGVRIATDYAGWAGPGVIPDVVTMNHAHETHYTDFPDPKITHVLRGWNPEGGHAEHSLQVRDVLIRNVPTNIRTWAGGGTELFGNSIFIFEVAGLCIGHLGHLHHELTAQQLGQIGRLDVVMVPVDGTFTLDHDGMMKVLEELHARLVLPMHFFGDGTLNGFLAKLKERFEVKISETPTIVLSRAELPTKPQVLVLPGF